MYTLMQEDPYDGEWPIGYFVTKDEADEALRFIYAHDEKVHPKLPREDWDWGYFVKEITTKTLTEFKSLYYAEEKLMEMIYREETTLGGDDCFIGRGLYRGESDTDSEYLTLSYLDYPDAYLSTD